MLTLMDICLPRRLLSDADDDAHPILVQRNAVTVFGGQTPVKCGLQDVALGDETCQLKNLKFLKLILETACCSFRIKRRSKD